MKNLGIALVGGVICVVGYLVGVHEMKYKVMKIMLEAEISKKK